MIIHFLVEFSFGNVFLIPPIHFPGSAVVKNLPANVGDPRDAGLIPGSERSLGVGVGSRQLPTGVGSGNPLQYFCLQNPMDRGVWRAIVHGVAKSHAQLSN